MAETIEDKKTLLQVYLETCTLKNLSAISKLLLQKEMQEKEIERNESVIVSELYDYIFAEKDSKILDICIKILS